MSCCAQIIICPPFKMGENSCVSCIYCPPKASQDGVTFGQENIDKLDKNLEFLTRNWGFADFVTDHLISHGIVSFDFYEMLDGKTLYDKKVFFLKWLRTSGPYTWDVFLHALMCNQQHHVVNILDHERFERLRSITSTPQGRDRVELLDEVGTPVKRNKFRQISRKTLFKDTLGTLFEHNEPGEASEESDGLKA